MIKSKSSEAVPAIRLGAKTMVNDSQAPIFCLLAMTLPPPPLSADHMLPLDPMMVTRPGWSPTSLMRHSSHCCTLVLLQMALEPPPFSALKNYKKGKKWKMLLFGIDIFAPASFQD
jgi:hypothetical protein